MIWRNPAAAAPKTAALVVALLATTATPAVAQFQACPESEQFVGAPRLHLAQLAGPQTVQPGLAGIWCGSMETVEDVGVFYRMEMRLPPSGAGEIEVVYVWRDGAEPQRVIQTVDVSVTERGEIEFAGRDVRPIDGGLGYVPDTFRCRPAGRDRLECVITDTAGDSGRAQFDRASG